MALALEFLRLNSPFIASLREGGETDLEVWLLLGDFLDVSE